MRIVLPGEAVTFVSGVPHRCPNETDTRVGFTSATGPPHPVPGCVRNAVPTDRDVVPSGRDGVSLIAFPVIRTPVNWEDCQFALLLII